MNSGRSERATGQADGTEDESGGSIDLATILHFVRFYLGSPRRHPYLASLVAGVVVAVSVALATWLPRSYFVDMRVVAHRNPVLVQHDTPPGDLVAGAADVILKRDNLVALIRDLDLVSRWDASRPASLRFKDSIMRILGGAVPTPEQKARAIVDVLEQHTFVSVDTASSSLTLAVDWPNAKDACDIVNALYATFIAARYEAEVSNFAAQLRVLDKKKELAATDVDNALIELTKIEQERQRDLEAAAEAPANAGDGGAATPPRASMSGARSIARPSAAPNSDLDVAQTLTEIRAKVRTMEGLQGQREIEADAQLADARAALGPLHPTVVALTRKAEAARETPPELTALRAQERQLVQQLADIATTAPSTSPPTAWTPPPASGTAPAPAMAPELRMATDLHNILTNHEDAPTTLARAKLAAASQQYNDLLGRTQASKVELDVARSSFKEEYSIMRPAEIPPRPRKPNSVLIVLGGLVGALFLFFAVPGTRDLLGGVLLESWQVETRLKLPVLGELSSDGVGALGPSNEDLRPL
jgi:uncharacterized protein involved in exopolysaccharide biosynthesis